MNRLSKSTAVVDCSNFSQHLATPHHQEVESISPPHQSSLGHVIYSDNSTLIKVMQEVASNIL